jgi:hypothetical protein
MSGWGVLATAFFGTLLVLSIAIQPHTSLRSRVKAWDPCYYLPTWTFFAPDPGVTDARLLWRERLVDGTVGPWHEAVPPATGLWRAVWNPTKRSRKVVFDWGRGLERRADPPDSEMFVLSHSYLMILQHLTGLSASPLGVARQFAVIKTQGADDAEGHFELVFVSLWHALPPPDRKASAAAGRSFEITDTVA